jgi:xylan 1,4-beta-xylosidase
LRIRKVAYLSLLLLVFVPRVQAQMSRTFCNPLNLDYGLLKGKEQNYRHGADPVIVLYKNRYYLFSTWDRPGYRVSDDLVSWKYIPFAEGNELTGKIYTAAAVTPIGDWLYYTPFGKEKEPVSLWRTKDPDSGKWEKVAAMPPYSDPCLFVDPPTSRVFMYHGLDRPIRGVELDRETFKEIPGSEKQLIDPIDPQHIRDGWEVCTWDNNEASPGMRSTKTFLPCREGSWMTFHDGTYYLQYASPGTTVPGYADGLFVGKNALGPFEYSQDSPISQKSSGFITSAGHSCLFRDKHGNWWRAVSMLIGVRQRMERRIGLFPAGFDSDGAMHTRTDLGDWPITLPDGKRDHLGDVGAGFWILSEGAKATASSALDDHAPNLAADEDVQTWWSGKTGSADEWLELDLGKICEIRAVQVNLAEQDYPLEPGKDVIQFVVSTSQDEKAWDVVMDRRAASVAEPHAYEQLEKPVPARYVRVQNVSMPAGAKFAISDLRVFGSGGGKAPSVVEGVEVKRDQKDRRKVTISWKASDGARDYLVRYGIHPNKLYQHHLIHGGQITSLTLYSLNAEPGYDFRIDAMNDSGKAIGSSIAHVP